MKDEWRVPGRATGALRCRIALPAIDFVAERYTKGERAALKLARFIKSQLPDADSALESGTFVISAEIRSAALAVRWKPLCRWRAGNSVDETLKRAVTEWARLAKEDWPGVYEYKFIKGMNSK